MCASKTSASRSSRYVTAGPTWSESAVLPDRGRDMGGQSIGDFQGFFAPDQSGLTRPVLPSSPVFTAGKDKGKKGKGKDGKDFLPPLVDGKGKGGTGTAATTIEVDPLLGI